MTQKAIFTQRNFHTTQSNLTYENTHNNKARKSNQDRKSPEITQDTTYLNLCGNSYPKRFSPNVRPTQVNITFESTKSNKENLKTQYLSNVQPK